MNETLNGWKQIASELDRSVRTAQRLEKKFGMSIRRLGNAAGAPVFAFKEELRRWLSSIPLEGTPRCVKPFIAFVQRLSQAPKKIQKCEHCKSSMQYLDGQFLLFGTNNKWNVFLPFCPTCEPELLRYASETVH